MTILPDVDNDGWVQSPHVVILGAGASKAACLYGDKNHNPIPLMNDLTQLLGLEAAYKKHGFKTTSDNFEETYQEICDAGKNTLRNEVEKNIWKYFSKLELPEELTLYDILVLSLREKDVIATFNWDPFLAQAWRRNGAWLQKNGFSPQEHLPQMYFLHGNVEIGYCAKHEPIRHVLNKEFTCCPECGGKIESTPLLFPIKQKNYNLQSSIKYQWDALQHFIGKAYLITIFGYGAPASDVEAISLMKSALDNNQTQPLNTTEIVNTEPEKILRKKWAPFFYTPSPHYSINKTLFDSRIARYPRRSCECLWYSTMKLRPIKGRPVSKRRTNLKRFQNWILKIINTNSPCQ